MGSQSDGAGGASPPKSSAGVGARRARSAPDSPPRSALAVRAVVSRALSYDLQPDQLTALPAGLVRAPVDVERELKVPGTPIAAREIAQGRAALPNRIAQYLLNRRDE